MVCHNNKPRYIRKYDYIKSLYSPKSLWFWSTNALNNELNKLIEKKNSNDFFEFNDEEENQFFLEDGYAYDLYDESKNLNDDLNDNDAKKIEGQYIDKKSQEYIFNFFKIQFEKLKIEPLKYIVVNFENKFKNCSLNEKCEKTINLLINYSNLIVFQPVFIFDEQIIDIPDAIVKINNELILIETKAAKIAKKRYIIDLIYQANVINKILKENEIKPIAKFFLCLIKDCPNKKMNVSFTLEEIFLNKLIDSKESDYSLTNNLTKKNKKKKQLFNNFVNVNKNFWKQIAELKAVKKAISISFTPCKQFKTFFEKNPFFTILQKKYYRVSNLYPFLGYSGNLIKFEEAIYLYEKNKEVKCDVFENFTYFYKKKIAINQPKKIIKNYYANMLLAKRENKTKFLITRKTINYLLTKQKKKKIYFDFETLNSCLAPINDCYPYRQIVTQVSIIANHDQTKIKNLKSKNFIIDPQKIDISWFKKIIDKILENVDNPNEYSFIVYNKSFEKNRLEEIKQYINDANYTKKIDGIIKNIFDLADCFNPQKEMACVIWENKGFYSIKFVLDFILTHNPNYLKILKIKSYKTLQIKNGNQAQNETTLRFFNLIDDKKWINLEKKLKEYCENDVWAMIVLEYWLWQNKPKD